MRNKKTRLLTHAALIGAMYVALTYLANLFGLASGAVQLRLSEVLTVLPVFTPAAVPGLFVGCLAANLLTGCAPWDVLFGSVATLLGGLGTYAIGKLSVRWRIFLSTLPPVAANTLIVPFVIRYVYASPDALPYLFFTVCTGEVISCTVLGTMLGKVLDRYKKDLF